MNTTSFAALAAALLFAWGAAGQGTNVAPGEQRLNQFQYHATHNSYERDDCGGVSIADQLDRYDVWMVEFDLRWRTQQGAFNDFWILHDCAEPCKNGAFDPYLDEIKNSHRATDGFTFLYFDSGDIDSCVAFPNVTAKPTNWTELLKAKLTGALGNRFYTVTDLENDSYKLPSVQELRRRGKNFIAIVNGSDRNFFFSVNGGDRRLIRYNTGEENEPLQASDLGDRYLARHYPGGGWLCNNGDRGWEWALENNYTFAASNCSDKGIVPGLHPPMPTYVTSTSTPGGRGTWLEPFALQNAITRVALHQSLKGLSQVEVQMNGGEHRAPARVTTSLRLALQPGASPARITQ